MTFSLVIPHQRLTFGLLRWNSLSSFGFLVPQILTLCLLTLPETWKVASLLKHILSKKVRSSEIRESMFNANYFLRGLSLGSSFCITCNLCGYLFKDLCKTLCTVLGGIISSLDAPRMDVEGEFPNFCCTLLIVSAVTFGLPLLLSSLTDPDFKKIWCQRRIDLIEGGGLP